MSSISNITNIVISAISNMSEYGYSQRNYAKVANIAIRFYQDILAGNNMKSLEVVAFPVTMTQRVWMYPQDCITYTKVAYKEHGTLKPQLMGLNEDMDIDWNAASCVVPTKNGDGVEAAFLAWGNGPFAYSVTTPVYASPGGLAKNYYRFDPKLRALRFSEGVTAGTAYIEYMSNGKDVTEATLVPVEYRATLEKYLMWQMILLSPKYVKLAPMFENQYIGSMIDSNYLNHGLSPSEAMAMIYRASGFTPR